jgi:hypothetical protein
VIPAKLEQLRHKLLNEERFGDAWEYFLAEVAEEDDFIRAGRALDPASPLSRHLLGLLGRASGIDPGHIESLLVEMPQFRFVHGSCKFAPTKVGGLIWFDDLECGLAAIMSLISPEVTYARISTMAAPGKPS